MNDDFGNISSDFLPPGYGDIPGKVQQRVDAVPPEVGEDAPTMETLSDTPAYDGLKDWKLFGGPGTNPTGVEEAVWELKHEDRVAGRDARLDAEAAKKEARAADADTTHFWSNWGKKDKSTAASAATATSSVAAPDKGYRDLSGRDNYVYRQFANGSIKILKDPTGARTGKTYSAGSQWVSAVAKMYGPYQVAAPSGGAASFLASLTGSSAPVSAAGGSRKGSGAGAGLGIGLLGAAGQLLPSLMSMLGPQQETVYDMPPVGGTMAAPSSGGTPWGLIAGGVVVVGLSAGALMYFRGKGGDGFEE
jgi:hypothetical protein